MIKIGKYNTLEVVKKLEHGFYLGGDDKWGDILLPNKFAPEDLKINDSIKVFLYLDSDDIIIATTETPYATVGQFASLEVSSIENFGLFLDWGLDKELFLPFREKLFDMEIGKKYVVYIYVDSSDRIAASTRIAKYARNKFPIPFKEHQKVDLLPYHTSDMGVNAIINGTYFGLIYKDEIYNPIELGKPITGYIKKVRHDKKIDLRLQPDGLSGTKDLSEIIMNQLKASGGSLPVNAKTPAPVINSMFNVSRKKFKMALGSLYKKKLIEIHDNSITST